MRDAMDAVDRANNRLLVALLAATGGILAILVLARTLSGRWAARLDRHRKIARWTLPVWLYVSVTGVIVYWMLYHL